MSFTANIFRVLIASPADLGEEREAATLAVNDWNAQHAAAEGIVLLPVNWETQSRPASGVRPQSAINTQLVQSCDLLVGMFWTRIGSPTGVAESGTVEEIDQFVANKRPALLYFSSRPIDPNKIDLKQHRKLRAFKAATYSSALTGSFASIDELRATLLRDLMSQVRAMKPARPAGRRSKLETAKQLTEMLAMQKQLNISPADIRELLGPICRQASDANQGANDRSRRGYGERAERTPDWLHAGRRQGRMDSERRRTGRTVAHAFAPKRSARF